MPDSPNPLVTAFAEAINAGDKDGVYALLADGASMSDDGSDRDLDTWLEREMFATHGRIKIESVTSQDGLSLVAEVTNDTWGAMRTTWKFFVDSNKITRFETGQA
ncbi:MAG TPA: nuclear transport factor 2 family protein [Pseudonocardiaceae bacterium]